MFTDAYRERATPDPELSEDVVLETVRTHIPDVETVSAMEGSGRTANVYVVDEHIVLKVHRESGTISQAKVQREVFFLNHLAEFTDVFVPRVLGSGTLRPDSPGSPAHDAALSYICLTRLPGISMQRADLSDDTRSEALYELGQMLRIIHSRPVEPFISSGLFADRSGSTATQDHIQHLFADAVAALETRPDHWDFTMPPREVAKMAVAKLPPSSKAAPLHANPGPGDVIVGPLTGELSGLIDFADSFVGHPAFDLAAWPAPADRQAVFAGYTALAPVDDEFLATLLVLSVALDMAAIGHAAPWREAAAEDLEALAAAF
ncbi:MAG: aminoglycoside phosphotransferase family protein [Alicyclobacillus sp.]|nr:aminoglycoside phosphotransferase family protein [Alicyclobacillus sp.]